MVENQNSSTEQVKETAPELTLGETATESEAVENEATSTEVAETAQNDAGNESDNDHGDTEDDGSDSKKSGKGFEKRIERFNRRLAEKEAEIEHWRKAALQSGQTQQTQSAPQPQVQTAKPKFADFNDIETYTEAVTEWKLAQREVAQRQQQLAQTYQQKEQAIRAKDPEYDEVIADFKDKYKHVNVPEVNQFIAESDIGPELFYHLANNTAEIDRILALNPIRRVAELGKLEAKLSTVGSADNKVVNKVSKAPKPVSKETGSAPAVKRLEDPNLSQAEYRQLRMQSKRRY